MIKALTTGEDGRPLVVIGLSFGNLDRFRAAPGDTFIKVDGKEMGLPVDIVIFSGETEAHCAASLPIGPETKVHIDRSQKN